MIWQLSNHLASIMDELVASQEAMAEESRLLCQLLMCNLWCIDLALGSRRGQEEVEEEEEEEEEEVEVLGEVERLEVVEELEESFIVISLYFI